MTTTTTAPSPTRSKFASRHATPEQWAAFLGALEQGRTVKVACRAAKVSAQAAYKRRRRDHEFASAWHTSQCTGADNKRDLLFGEALALADKKKVRERRWDRLQEKFEQIDQIREQLDLEVKLVWQPFYARLKEVRRTFLPPAVNGSRPQNFLTGHRHSHPDRGERERMPREATPQERPLADMVLKKTGVRVNSPQELRRMARELGDKPPPRKGRAGVLW